jgi:cyanophycin synthetase
MGLPGDRRDEDLLATLEATLPFTDEYILYDLADRRGRAPGKVPQLLCDHLPAGRPRAFAANEREDLLLGWQRARQGERLVVIINLVDESIEQLNALMASAREDAECIDPIIQERGVAAS